MYKLSGTHTKHICTGTRDELELELETTKDIHGATCESYRPHAHLNNIFLKTDIAWLSKDATSQHNYIPTHSYIPNFIKLIYKNFRLPHKTEFEIIKTLWLLIQLYNKHRVDLIFVHEAVAFKKLIYCNSRMIATY